SKATAGDPDGSGRQMPTSPLYRPSSGRLRVTITILPVYQMAPGGAPTRRRIRVAIAALIAAAPSGPARSAHSTRCASRAAAIRSGDSPPAIAASAGDHAASARSAIAPAEAGPGIATPSRP